MQGFVKGMITDIFCDMSTFTPIDELLPVRCLVVWFDECYRSMSVMGGTRFVRLTHADHWTVQQSSGMSASTANHQRNRSDDTRRAAIKCMRRRFIVRPSVSCLPNGNYPVHKPNALSSVTTPCALDGLA
jgi:hypothetical protein